MSRPADYGDQFPSDLGDSPPVNPTDGFQEGDYTIASIPGAGGIKGKNPRKENPDLGKPFVKEQLRTTHQGVIIQPNEIKGSFQILRQDGFIVTALLNGDDREYESYRIGDDVTIVYGQTPGVYTIEGVIRNQEYRVIDVYNTEQVGPTNTQKDIFFADDGVVTKFGSCFDLLDGYVFVRTEDSALYEIHYSAVVELVDPDDPSSTIKINITNQCGETTPEPKKTNTLDFKRDVGFKVEAKKCSASVTLNVGETDYGVYSPAGGGDVKWSNEPRFGSALMVGTQVGQGWIKIVSNGGGELWLGHGAGQLKLLFPDGGANKAGFLYAAGIAPKGGGVKLAWTPTPGCGYIRFYDGYGEQKEWKVERGLIMSGPDITPCTDDVQFVVQEPEKKIWQC